MSMASRPRRRPRPVAPHSRGQSAVGCFIILGVMAVGAVVGVAYVRMQFHETTVGDTAGAALGGAGGACLVGLALAFVLGLPNLLRTYPAATLAFLAAIAVGAVAALVTLLVFRLPQETSGTIIGTIAFAAGVATFASIQAPPGKRLKTFLFQFLQKTLGSPDD